MSKKLIFLITLLLLVAFLFISIHVFGDRVTFGTVSTTDLDPTHIEITREQYPLRHWMWLGTFSLFGSFMPDPHFSLSSPAPLNNALRGKLNDEKARYQTIEINTFFDPGYFESILALEVNQKVHQYRLNVPKNARSILAPNVQPNFELFLGDEKIIVLAFFYITDRPLGFFTIDLPLKNTESVFLDFHDLDSPEGQQILEFLKLNSYEAVKRQSCELPPNAPLRKFFNESLEAC